MNEVGMPGPDGSLGQCALCGAPFLYEILTGKAVKSITVSGCDQTLFAHDACIKKYSGHIDAAALPLTSPLRLAYWSAVAQEAFRKRIAERAKQCARDGAQPKESHVS
jgi:hypothetical protein